MPTSIAWTRAISCLSAGMLLKYATTAAFSMLTSRMRICIDSTCTDVSFVPATGSSSACVSGSIGSPKIVSRRPRHDSSMGKRGARGRLRKVRQKRQWLCRIRAWRSQNWQWSVKIVRVEFEVLDFAGVQTGDALGANRRHAVLILQDAVHEQEGLIGDDQPIADEEIGPHDDVRDAGLVFQREKHEAFRGPRPLARDDHAGHADAPALARRAEIDGARHAARGELVAPQRHRMPPDRQSGSGIIRDNSL